MPATSKRSPQEEAAYQREMQEMGLRDEERPGDDETLLAVYRHDPDDPKGNEERSQASMSNLMAKVAQRHSRPKNGNKP